MNYGYIVGQEAASLTYFEARLRSVSNPDERRDLEIVIQTIKRTLEAERPDVSSVERIPSHFSLSFQGGMGR